MNYESMIDDLNMDYKFFLQECSIEAIPYNALNEGAIIDTIKKVFITIADFFKGIIKFIKGLFVKSNDIEDSIKQNEKIIAEIKANPTGLKVVKNGDEFKVTIIDKTNLILHGGLDNLYAETAIKYIDKFSSSCDRYIRTGENKPGEFKVNEEDLDFINNITNDMCKTIEISPKDNPNWVKDLQEHNESAKKQLEWCKKEMKTLKSASDRAIVSIKNIETKFRKEADNGDAALGQRLNYVVGELNKANRCIARSSKSIKEVYSACETATKSMSAVLNNIK